jgi:hypothetical protein
VFARDPFHDHLSPAGCLISNSFYIGPLSRALQLGRVRYMNDNRPAWLLLITNLPGQNQTRRMRIWRALKAAGAGLLRDGVYVLPQTDLSRQVFEEQAGEIRAVAGTAHILSFESDSPEQHSALIELFNRTTDYQELNTRLAACKKKLTTMAELEARRALAAIARDLEATAATDFFPGQTLGQMQSALSDAEAELDARFSPNEPKAAHREIPRFHARDYRGRTWATREHLWIDRVCSAWLIRRFIDPKARFVWLKRPKDCPKRAIGFDFDGALFTHVDSKVTFEVLVQSFGLGTDPALTRLGALVRFLDVGGIPVPEAAGFAAIVSGTRTLQPDDDALLRQVSPVLDSLYRSYSRSEHDGAAGATQSPMKP